jgi:hypothetical protein
MFSNTKVRSESRRILLVAMAACLCSPVTVHAQRGSPAVGKQRILISAPSGKAELAGLMSFDWSKPQPDAKAPFSSSMARGATWKVTTRLR